MTKQQVLVVDDEEDIVEFLTQLDLLLADRSVAIVATPMSDAPHGSTEATRCSLALDNPNASTRLAPVVGKAQQVESARSVARIRFSVTG